MYLINEYQFLMKARNYLMKLAGHYHWLFNNSVFIEISYTNMKNIMHKHNMKLCLRYLKIPHTMS